MNQQNGRPRVRNPYDTSDVREVLAQLDREGIPSANTVSLPAVPVAGHVAGFLEYLIEEYFSSKTGYSRQRKDVTAAKFGQRDVREQTITWAQTVDLTIPGGVTTVSLAKVGTKQTVHVSRDHPTSHTVLSQIILGPGWTGDPAELITILFTYFIGVGTTKIAVQRSLSSGASPFNGQIVSAIDTLPFMSLQGTAQIQAVNLGAETTPLSIQATSMVAPVVM